jgi:hypothetical protein
MGKITGILRKHFKSCQKSTEARKLSDRIQKKQTRGGTAPKKSANINTATPEVSTPTVHGIGFGHMPRHGNKLSNSEV